MRLAETKFHLGERMTDFKLHLSICHFYIEIHRRCSEVYVEKENMFFCHYV